MGIRQTTSFIVLKPLVLLFYSWLALCLQGMLFRAKVTCFPSPLLVIKNNLSALPAPGPPSTITGIPLPQGTYSQRSCVRHRRREFLSLNFAFLVSVVALGFAALSRKHIFLTLKLSYCYCKAQGPVSYPIGPYHYWSAFSLNGSIHRLLLLPWCLIIDHFALTLVSVVC